MIFYEEYDRIENLFSGIFHVGIKNGGITLVVVREQVLKNEFLLFLEERRAPFVYNYETDSYGFYIVEEFPDELEMLYFTSIAEVRTNGSVPRYEEVPKETQCLCAILKTNPEPSFWDESENNNPDYPNVECYLMNDQLRPMFLDTFQIAEKEIDLICPWLNRKVVDEKMILRFRRAISRGVKIKICFGIGTEVSDTRQTETERTVEMLKNRFADTNLLSFNKGNTHIKYLICDDKYMMVGSYNLLSFVADYNDEDVREEGMEFIVDKAQIKQRREQLFSWE